MTLSRHSQVENLSGLLSARRTAQRQQIRRQAAYLGLASRVLGCSVADLELTSPPTSLTQPVASLPTLSKAA